jgi:DNA-binding NtrC family response regulator
LLRVARSLRQSGVETLAVQGKAREMATIWLVSEDPVLTETLALHLRARGKVWKGPPERSRWKDAEGPDLLVVAALDAPSGDLSGLERLLGFIRTLPSLRRGPTPTLYIEPPGGQPSAALARSLIDDRPVRSVSWPLEPDEILAAAGALLDAPARPPSLRERARRAWVTRRVELFYADLDLPALRHAIDPRNAARPVFLFGENGTGKGLLARYIQNLAEPAREELVLVPAPSLERGRVEARILELCAARRVSVYLEGLGRADRALQEEIAQLLGQSGVLGVEPIRWIASATEARQIVRALRGLPWIRVDLPPLRKRPDLDNLARTLTQRWAERASREIELADDALEALHHYAWPGNLQELDSVLDASLAASSGPVLGAGDLRIAPQPETAPGTPAPLDVSEPPEAIAEELAEPADREREAEAPAAQPVPAAATFEAEPTSVESRDADADPGLLEIMAPLAQEIRQPVLAIRTYASLLEQRPNDASVRRDLVNLVEGDLAQLDQLLARLESFTRFGPARCEPLDLASLVTSELERRQAKTRARSLVVLRELEPDAPPTLADDTQLRFALGGLLDRALRMVPEGGDLYIGSHHHPAQGELPARHRLLIRFHSPEEVLVAPDDTQGPRIPLDVLTARALILRMHGTFAIDSSGAQDNVILIELPA